MNDETEVGQSFVADMRVRKVLGILQRDFHKHITVTDLASQVGLSSSRLQHLFRRTTGRTMKQELKKIRLQQGLRLLKLRQLSVKQVCFRIGYCCSQDFSRDFKRYHGHSPSQVNS